MLLAPLYPDPSMEVMPEAPSVVAGAACQVPADFQPLPARRLQRIDRRLGYFGTNRFVAFYYEPRGDEVVWNDGRSYGFACGGWQAFTQDVAPIADSAGADLGDSQHRGAHALVVDRRLGQVYFADQAAAKRFVQEQST